MKFCLFVALFDSLSFYLLSFYSLLGFRPLMSFDGLSLDPMAFNHRSFDPMSVNPYYQRAVL